MQRQNVKTAPLIQTFYALGTINSFAIYGANAQKASQEAMERVYDIDNRMSALRSDSEVSRINEFAGLGTVEVNFDTYFVIKKALQYAQLTNALGDITVAPLLKLWREAGEIGVAPDETMLREKLALIDYNDVRLGKNTITVKLNRKGQMIDLGSIAKGYAADEVKKIFLKHDVTSAIIDLGGNVLTVGTREDGNPWQIGIQHPMKEQGHHIGILSVSDQSVVTSGDYERFYITAGEKHHHIIDPRTGYPSQSGLTSVTVVSDSSLEADALTTALFIMGLDAGMALVHKLSGVEAIFITDNGKVHVTKGLKDSFMLTDAQAESI